MTRPSLTNITHDQQGWDADINDNSAVIGTTPFPPALYATSGSLPNAATHDGCVAAVGSAAPYTVYLSNGTSWARLMSADAMYLGFRTITTSDTAERTDSVILANATSGSLTYTLEPAADVTGKVISIKKVNITNSVTIDADGSETIDGSATLVLSALYSSLTIISDSNRWLIL